MVSNTGKPVRWILLRLFPHIHLFIGSVCGAYNHIWRSDKIAKLAYHIRAFILHTLMIFVSVCGTSCYDAYLWVERHWEGSDVSPFARRTLTAKALVLLGNYTRSINYAQCQADDHSFKGEKGNTFFSLKIISDSWGVVYRFFHTIDEQDIALFWLH